jgi:molybdopterin-containing oxidoreductase family iron-sulfur binding subunit
MNGDPPDPPDPLDRLSRRGFFKLAGIGLAACSSRPAREILPYAGQTPEIVPGVPRYYATCLVEDGFATGVVVASHEGRPTKIEGNPDHPASLGATRAIEQASVLGLYDSGRAQAITDRGVPTTWSAIASWLVAAREAGGMHVLAEPTTSPIEIELIERARAAGVTFTFWSPFEPRASLAGNALAFGRPLQTQLDLSRADVIVTLDADVVGAHPMALAYARQLADRRRVVDASSAMSRIYAVEAAYTPTGVLADHRLAVRPSQVGAIARRLLDPGAPRATGQDHAIGAIARDLARAGARAVVIAGERQSPEVHALTAAINTRLGSGAVSYSEPVAFEAGRASHDLSALATALDRGEVRSLIVLGGDPVYAAGLQVERAGASLYLGLYANATARAARFVVPGLHDLEHWGAARAYDGTLAPQQPLIEPLFGGHASADLLHQLLGDPPATPRARVAAAWQRLVPTTDLERALARGVVDGSAARRVEVTARSAPEVEASAPAGVELEVRPHPYLHDGRHATNPWLRELPEPITKLTWDQAAQISDGMAARLGISTGGLIELATVRLVAVVPVVVVSGHADGVVTLLAGFGQPGVPGTNALRLTPGPIEVHARDGQRQLAITQGQLGTKDRPIALAGTIAQLRDAAFREEIARQRGAVASVIADFPQRGPQWAMSIDLTTCTGCSACVMACSAENNTPVVGRDRVLDKREMQWLRIDRYVEGDVIAVQPMACQHCEKAPCEYVCPVEATTHSPDGLNEMTYNRCIGTRFCSNNCPYKVRRFNWFDFKDRGLRVLGKNPEVTVRDRGVMEKCTYCVQRIRRAEIDARLARRPIGDVRTACQQACPTEAIAFGSIADPTSVVTEHRRRPHSYAVLHDQGTVPRTRYLARIRNPNPEWP